MSQYVTEKYYSKRGIDMTHYTKVAEIGRGGFGVVERVRDGRGRSFARKTFSPGPHIPADVHDKLRKRFKREVKIQAELGGNEILPVLASDLEDENPWFVMPLAEKIYETQIQEDRRTGKVDIDAIADILNALQYLHDFGYVHRDLNPKNILLHEGHWKLSDLGAVLPPTGGTVTLTEGTVIYTEQYCSPEQRADFHSAQSSADVYAFGCILHDIFGSPPRTPYARHHAPSPVGIIIEKCTETNPRRRPSIKVLREMLLENLVEIGGHCKVEDRESEGWLKKLDELDSWGDTEYGEFALFFAQLDVKERVSGHENEWVYSLSTPFLTRLPSEALIKIVGREDGLAGAIVEKYCGWAGNTAFLFHFADTVCSRLEAIFDNGTAADKAAAIVALIRLGESHNRWYVMREMLRRCGSDQISKELARRIAIEIRTEEVEREFRRCVEEVKWDVSLFSSEIGKLCK
jgi:serine/threonine protein kinase